ncbi:MAG: hypothetical protein JNK05_16500 [Myxococcales bacterium]|nr:hypothetical protein [Myxococcales bacterium]
MADTRRPSLAARFIEYFTLANAGRAGSRVDRSALGRGLEAVRRAANEAAERWADSDADPALDALAEAEERYRRDVEALFTEPSVLQRLTSYAPPTEDARTTVSTFVARLDRLDRATRALSVVAGGPFVRWSVRALRLSVLALALVTVGRIAVDYAKKPSLRASASGAWGDHVGVVHLTDGSPETNWLLPDHTAGWARVSFSPRSLRAVRLYSVRRLPLYGAQQCSIEIELRGRIVRTERIDVSATVGQRAPYVYRLPSAIEADAVRVHIHSWHAIGGGFSEIEIE